MGQKADKGRDGADPQEDRQRRAEQIERDLAERDLEQAVDDMKAPGINDPQALDAVMQGMETPERQVLVGQAMGEIEAEFGDDESQHDLEGHRQLLRPDICFVAQERLRNDCHRHRK